MTIRCIWRSWRRTIAALATVAAARSLSLDLVRKREHPIVTGDAALSEVAITNLGDNAIAFSPAGVAVTITIEADVAITVQDAGPGIAVPPAKRRQRRGVRDRAFRA